MALTSISSPCNEGLALASATKSRMFAKNMLSGGKNAFVCRKGREPEGFGRIHAVVLSETTRTKSFRTTCFVGGKTAIICSLKAIKC